MGLPSDAGGSTPRNPRPIEHEAVLTTIVGGRPPGSGQPVGQVPRGIEVLVKKAAVDPEFKKLLLEERAEAALEIGLGLEPAETLMLRAVPGEQLERIIAGTSVPPEHRRAFLGKVAAAMLATLGMIAPGGCSKGTDSGLPPVKGIAPDRPEEKEKLKERPPREIIKGNTVDRPPAKEPLPDQPEELKMPKEEPPPDRPSRDAIKGILPDQR